MTHQIHHVPGRLRVRVPSVKGNPECGGVVEASMRGISGVKHVRSNTLTGSVVVEYDPGVTDTASLFAGLREHGFRQVDPFAAPPGVSRRSSSLQPSPAMGEKVAKAIAMYVVEKAIERSVPLLIAALL